MPQIANENTVHDRVQTFQLELCPIRGRVVKLGATLDTILHRHAYPKAVATLLAEAITIGAALSTAMKFEGLFTMQAKGDGAIRLLVVDVTHDGAIRAYAMPQEDYDFSHAPVDTSLLGKAYLAFTVDQQLKEERWQGIVELEGGSLSEAVQHYFRQSEQIPTAIKVAVRQDKNGSWRGGCVMLQQMPREGGNAPSSTETADDDWQRTTMLLNTCTDDELVSDTLTTPDLLYRLFHEENVRAYDPLALRHECRCSQTRVENMLGGLPRDEIEALAVNGIITVTCEFCNRAYMFNKGQRDGLFAENVPL
jgi:molecular chaperone Hsp33